MHPYHRGACIPLSPTMCAEDVKLGSDTWAAAGITRSLEELVMLNARCLGAQNEPKKLLQTLVHCEICLIGISLFQGHTTCGAIVTYYY